MGDVIEEAFAVVPLTVGALAVVGGEVAVGGIAQVEAGVEQQVGRGGAHAGAVGQEIADALGILLRRTTRAQLYKALTVDMGEAVDELTYPVLSALARTGPRSAAELAPDAGLDRSGVTRRASRLEEAGLLRREPDLGDRRAALLVLTERGERTVDELRRRLAAHITQSLSTWPPGEAQTFARCLRRIITEGPFA